MQKNILMTQMLRIWHFVFRFDKLLFVAMSKMHFIPFEFHSMVMMRGDLPSVGPYYFQKTHS